MPPSRLLTTSRCKVTFPWHQVRLHTHRASAGSSSSASSKMTSTSDNGDAPAWSPWTAHPKIHDRRETETSVTQSDTVELLLPLLHRDDDGPTLERDKHVTYLHSCLGKLPSAFIGLDASRPWQIYWTLAGLSLLGEDVTRYRSGCVDDARFRRYP